MGVSLKIHLAFYDVRRERRCQLCFLDALTLGVLSPPGLMMKIPADRGTNSGSVG